MGFRKSFFRKSLIGLVIYAKTNRVGAPGKAKKACVASSIQFLNSQKLAWNF